MKNKFKIYMLVVFMFLLTGCGWKDVYKEHKKVLDNGVSCEYNYSKSENVDCGKSNSSDCSDIVSKKIELSADSDGFYVNDEKVSGNSVYIGSDLVYLTYFDYNEFLNDYKDNGECPSTISYGYQDEYHTDYNLYYHNNTGALKHIYTIVKKNNSTGSEDASEEFDKNCKSSRALSCKNYVKKDYWGNFIYIQLGRQKTTSNEVREYFVVSYNSFYSGAEVVYKGNYTGDDGSLAVVLAPSNEGYAYDKQYFYLTSEYMDKVFIGENDYLNDIYLKYAGEGTVGSTYSYYIESEPVEENNQYEGNTSPVEKPTDNNINNNTPPKNFLFCKQSGILKTFQIVGIIIFLIKVVVPLLLLIFGSIDMAKAMMAGDEKAIQNNAYLLAIRAAAGVIIFFIPTIINFATSLLSNWTSIKSEFKNCHTCLFDISECQNIIDKL